ncbi:MAG TPA: hypothetical protein VJJ26_05615 [Candidatus Babeliales bacterium]|nr:hypothetical protein [Candidatus Babeliales bacterium]
MKNTRTREAHEAAEKAAAEKIAAEKAAAEKIKNSWAYRLGLC